VKAQCD